MTTAWPRLDAPTSRRQFAASKVPAVITVYFWIAKLLTTAMGEATSDYLAHKYNPYIVVTLGGIALAIVLLIQLSARRYITWLYWLAVVMVAIFGTMAADAAHIAMHVPYAVSTVAFSIALIVIFSLWYATERTLSIHSIYTRRRELYYWATVLATFALGTAAGDMTARTVGLGFLASGVMFAVVIAIPAIAHWKMGMNSVLAFWFAYVVTRPLGASFADYFGLGHAYGGVGYGYGTVSLVLTFLIIGFVWYLAASRKDMADGDAGQVRKGGRHRMAQAHEGPQPAYPQSTHPQSTLPQSTHPQSMHPLSTHPHPVRPESGRPHPAHPQPAHPQPAHPQPAHPQPAHPLPVRQPARSPLADQAQRYLEQRAPSHSWPDADAGRPEDGGWQV